MKLFLSPHLFTSKVLLFIFLINISVTPLNAQTGFTNKAEAENKKADGIKEGKWIEYYDSNIKETSVEKAECYFLTVYKAGRIIAETAYFMDGKIKQEIPYFDGKKNGPKKVYYQNGQLAAIYTYKDNIRNGVYEKYYDNGTVSCKGTSINGKENGMETNYTRTGKLSSEILYTDGKKNGAVKEFYETGEVMATASYSYGLITGTIKRYFKNGALESETPYVNGKVNGVSKAWFDNGNLRGELTSVNGKKEGEFKTYYKNGDLMKVDIYKSDTVFKYGETLPDKNNINKDKQTDPPIDVRFTGANEQDAGKIYAPKIHSGSFQLKNHGSGTVSVYVHEPGGYVTVTTGYATTKGVLKPGEIMEVTYTFNSEEFMKGGTPDLFPNSKEFPFNRKINLKITASNPEQSDLKTFKLTGKVVK